MKFTTTKHPLHPHRRRAWKTSNYRDESVRLPVIARHKWRTIKVSNGHVVDNFGRLETVKHDDQTTTYEYDAFGNLSKTTTDTGSERLIATYQYDNMNRLVKLTNFVDTIRNGVFDSGEGISEFEYTLNDIGQKTKALEKFWADYDDDGIIDLLINNIDWEYDSLGRLTSEVFDHYANENDQTSTWGYDVVGNRLRQEVDKGNNGTIDNVTTYEYDENDRLLKEEFDGDNNGTFEKQTDYGYDHTQQTSKVVTEDDIRISETTFEYDAQGRMSVVTIVAGSRKEITKYEYGADGIRVSAEHEIYENNVLASKARTEYLNDAQSITGYSQVLKQTETDVVTGKETVTTYVIGHQRISQTVKSEAENVTHFFTFDGHGSTRALLDFAGAIVQLYSFDAYGNAIGFNPSEALTEFLYSAEQFDAKIGQQYLRARYYDPATGRFNRLDPFFGNLNDPQSLHKYLYTHANPVNGIDPSGMMSLGNVGVAMAIGGSIGGMSGGAIGGYLGGWEGFKMGVGFGSTIGAGIGVGWLFMGPSIMAAITNSANWVMVGQSVCRMMAPTGIMGGNLTIQIGMRSSIALLQNYLIGYGMRSFLYPIISEIDRLDNRLNHVKNFPREKILAFRTKVTGVSNAILGVIQGNINNQFWAPLKSQLGAGWNMGSMAVSAFGVHEVIQMAYQLMLDMAIEFIDEHNVLKNMILPALDIQVGINKEESYVIPNYISGGIGIVWGTINPDNDIRLFSSLVSELDNGNYQGAARDISNLLDRISLYGIPVINGVVISPEKVKELVAKFA